MVGHIQHFHCIKVFSGYTASSTLMAYCVNLIELTDSSLVKITVKIVKFGLWDNKKAPLQKSSKPLGLQVSQLILL